jgi:hypothetical protein
MIRMLRQIWWFFFMAVAVEILSTACSERASEPVILPDSTIVFPSKKADGVSATITLSRKLNQKSGRQSAIATILPLKNDENIYAVVDLENRLLNINNDLMFHIDWIGPDGKSFYLKRIDILPGDSTALLVSSISVEPGKRPPGEYLVRIYLFRELIAEKHFELRPEPEIEKVQANIIFYKSLDKESGQLTGVDTVFAIRKKGVLRAQTGLSNLNVYKDDELPFRLEWIGPDGQSFYSKKIDFQQADTVSTITGSISITPDKRQPGEYFLRIYLFDDIVGEKRFVLMPSE